MPVTTPRLDLSLGQVAWCLAGGHKPPNLLLAQLRYLRQLGVPFEPAEQGQGRGVRLSYGFYHLIELGVAYEGLRRRVQPRFLKKLVEGRKQLRKLYRQTYAELAVDPDLYAGDPCRYTMYAEEYHLYLFDPGSPGEIVFAMPEGDDGLLFGDLVLRSAREPDRVVVAMKALTARLLRLAQIAPKTKPGPQV